MPYTELGKINQLKMYHVDVLTQQHLLCIKYSLLSVSIVVETLMSNDCLSYIWQFGFHHFSYRHVRHQ